VPDIPRLKDTFSGVVVESLERSYYCHKICWTPRGMAVYMCTGRSHPRFV
jgi:hypothetical protein